MSQITPDSGRAPGLPARPARSLDDCQTDATVIHGLIVAMELCDNFRGGSDDRRAVNAMGSIQIVLEGMADRLANDLDRLTGRQAHG